MTFLCLGLGATINVAKPPKGSTVAIFGLGAVGLAVSLKLFAHYMLFQLQ
jgi:Zn-dependent alcohol dehydrogenase